MSLPYRAFDCGSTFYKSQLYDTYYTQNGGDSWSKAADDTHCLESYIRDSRGEVVFPTDIYNQDVPDLPGLGSTEKLRINNRSNSQTCDTWWSGTDINYELTYADTWKIYDFNPHN